jgi:hypothetical protein
MDRKRYPRFVAIIFSIIAILHGLRFIFGWEAVIAGLVMPIWLSAVVVFVAGCLAYYGYKFGK